MPAEPTVESVRTARSSEAPARLAVRAVLFDFDATLTSVEELQMERLFPEVYPGRGIDVAWLRQKAFGGEARIAALGTMLQELTRRGIELHVVSFADRPVIVRALAILGALHFFCNRIVGWEELGGPLASKGAYIRELMEANSWDHEQVIFVDDQEPNIFEAHDVCITHQVQGVGLSVEEMSEIVRKATSLGETAAGCADLATAEAAKRKRLALAEDIPRRQSVLPASKRPRSYHALGQRANPSCSSSAAPTAASLDSPGL